jgi:chaperonin GroEL
MKDINLIRSGAEGKKLLLEGINKVADAVKITSGEEGKFVLIESSLGLPPHPTKDGVTVLNSIYGSNQFEELGAKLLKQAANKTAEEVGDNTTLTTIMAQSIINNLFCCSASHAEMKRGLDKALKDTIKELDRLKTFPVDFEDMKDIATVSANGDREIGLQIATMYDKVGLDCVVEVKEGYGETTKVNYTKGFKLDRGWILPHFCTDFDKGIAEYEDCYLLLYNAKINNLADISEYVSKALSDAKPIVIVADDCEETVLASLVKIKNESQVRIIVTTSPEYGERREKALDDLASVTGATVYSERLQTKAELGLVKKFTAFRDKTVVSVEEEALDSRVEELQRQLDNYNEEDNDLKVLLSKRIANLKSSIVEIVVGGVTDLEIKEKKDRIEDAVPAVRNAIEDGYVAGGGSTLYYISDKLRHYDKKLTDGELIGYEMFKRSLKEPMKVIMDNAGLRFSYFGLSDRKIQSTYGYGVNVKTRKVENLLDSGIIDPVKGIKVALKNAVSVSKIAISTEVLVTNRPIA